MFRSARVFLLGSENVAISNLNVSLDFRIVSVLSLEVALGVYSAKNAVHKLVVDGKGGSGIERRV